MIVLMKGFEVRSYNSQTQLQNYRANKTLEIMKSSAFQTYKAMGFLFKENTYKGFKTKH